MGLALDQINPRVHTLEQDQISLQISPLRRKAETAPLAGELFNVAEKEEDVEGFIAMCAAGQTMLGHSGRGCAGAGVRHRQQLPHHC